MTINSPCPGCDRCYVVDNDRSGRRVRCDNYAREFTIVIAGDETKSPKPQADFGGNCGGSGESGCHGPLPSCMPSKLFRFEIRAEIGAGAIGRMYRAFDSILCRAIAHKVPREELKQREEYRSRFLREPQAADVSLLGTSDYMTFVQTIPAADEAGPASASLRTHSSAFQQRVAGVLKACPRCAEWTQLEAQVRRHCRYAIHGVDVSAHHANPLPSAHELTPRLRMEATCRNRRIGGWSAAGIACDFLALVVLGIVGFLADPTVANQDERPVLGSFLPALCAASCSSPSRF